VQPEELRRHFVVLGVGILRVDCDRAFAQRAHEAGVVRGPGLVGAGRFLGQPPRNEPAHAEARERIRDPAALAQVDDVHDFGGHGTSTEVVRT
jgi:hypothetical protein